MSEQREGFSGKNLRDYPALFELSQYQVAEWVPGDNGIGKPEAVALQFDLGREFDGVSFMFRFKSRRAVNELMQLLAQYRDRVWGGA
jgi:hypothetical protein